MNMRRRNTKKMQLILLSKPVWMRICRKIDEISRKDLIAVPRGIRRHKKTPSRVCGYHTAEIREKYYLSGCVHKKILG